MSEMSLEQEAATIAEFLGLEWEYNGTSVADGIVFCDVMIHPLDVMWQALLRLARQPRGLPAEAPEGHERVRYGFDRRRDGRISDILYRIWNDSIPENYGGIVVFDVPLPRAVEIVGSVEP